MKDVLFDADAFLCIRKLSFLRTLEAGKGKWLMTGYIAKHELSDVVAEIGAFCAAERLQIHQQAQHHPDVDIRWSKVTIAARPKRLPGPHNCRVTNGHSSSPSTNVPATAPRKTVFQWVISWI